MHSCVVVNSRSCSTTVIRCRLEDFPPVVVLVLYLQERGSNNAMTSQLTSKPYEVMSADDCSGNCRSSSTMSCSVFLLVLAYRTSLFCVIFPAGCSQMSVSSSLLRLSQSLYLHNWCVSDRGMLQKLFIINYSTEAFFFCSPEKIFMIEQHLHNLAVMHTQCFP